MVAVSPLETTAAETANVALAAPGGTYTELGTVKKGWSEGETHRCANTEAALVDIHGSGSGRPTPDVGVIHRNRRHVGGDHVERCRHRLTGGRHGDRDRARRRGRQ